MRKIRVAVHGAAGRMGREVIKAVSLDSKLQLVGAVEKRVTKGRLILPDGTSSVPYGSDVETVIRLSKPEVLVDFSLAEACMEAAPVAFKQKVHMVIGTTGLSQGDIDRLGALAEEDGVGVAVAPNFALGAILMMHFAKIAARYFDYAEITEMHHVDKVDAPSGTALATARAMVATRKRPFSSPTVLKETLAGTRGASLDGVRIHSVRLPGLIAHQEVLMGAAGQTLSIRHDTVGRECYMPGVILAIKKVVNHRGLILGLDKLLGL
jgi:4-hydroxy-tetrahydrodipicolinate reductase